MALGDLVAIVFGLFAVWALLIGLLWAMRPRGVRLHDLVRVVPDVLRLIRDLIADRSVPLRVRVVLAGLLVWLISPIDLIPDFVPVVGPVDDLIVTVVVLSYVRRRLGDGELRRHWRGSEEAYELLGSILR